MLYKKYHSCQLNNLSNTISESLDKFVSNQYKVNDNQYSRRANACSSSLGNTCTFCKVENVNLIFIDICLPCRHENCLSSSAIFKVANLQVFQFLIYCRYLFSTFDCTFFLL